MENQTISEYRLTDDERRHIAEVQAQIRTVEDENLRFEGSIRKNEREVSMMRRHLSLYTGQLATVHKLPMGARLSADGSTLLAKSEATEG